MIEPIWLNQWTRQIAPYCDIMASSVVRSMRLSCTCGKFWWFTMYLPRLNNVACSPATGWQSNNCIISPTPMLISNVLDVRVGLELIHKGCVNKINKNKQNLPSIPCQVLNFWPLGPSLLSVLVGNHSQNEFVLAVPFLLCTLLIKATFRLILPPAFHFMQIIFMDDPLQQTAGDME